MVHIYSFFYWSCAVLLKLLQFYQSFCLCLQRSAVWSLHDKTACIRHVLFYRFKKNVLCTYVPALLPFFLHSGQFWSIKLLKQKNNNEQLLLWLLGAKPMDFHCPSLKAILDQVVVSVGSNMVVTFQMLPCGLCSFEQGDLLRQRHRKRYYVMSKPSSSCSLVLAIYKAILHLCLSVIVGETKIPVGLMDGIVSRGILSQWCQYQTLVSISLPGKPN